MGKKHFFACSIFCEGDRSHSEQNLVSYRVSGGWLLKGRGFGGVFFVSGHYSGRNPVATIEGIGQAFDAPPAAA
jgi:hypothetical protein